MRYLYINRSWLPELKFFKGTERIRYYDDSVLENIPHDILIEDSGRSHPFGPALDMEVAFSSEPDFSSDPLIPNFQKGDTLIFLSLLHFAVPLWNDELINKVSYFSSIMVDVHFNKDNYTLRFSDPDEYLNGQIDTLITMRDYVGQFELYRDKVHRDMTKNSSPQK